MISYPNYIGILRDPMPLKIQNFTNNILLVLVILLFNFIYDKNNFINNHFFCIFKLRKILTII